MEIVVILGVQAAVIGTVAGLNYSNNSEGYASWASWTWTTDRPDEQQHGSDTELSQEPPAIVVHRKRSKHAIESPNPTAAPALRDFEWHFKEEMEFAYE
jgi:hypothetical protein